MSEIFITGCSRGIGKAITEQLIAEKKHVTGTWLNTAPADFEGSSYFRGIQADLSLTEELEQKVKPALHKRPDVLINNAGIFEPAPFSSADEEWLRVWDRTLDVNLRSAALLSKWFINAHVNNGSGGIIINIASRAAYRGDTQEYAAYAASKAGLTAFTKSIARDFSRKGIIAYTIAPGFIETDMARASVETLGEEALTRGSAFDEITQPVEVASLAAFLARGEVTHMSGSTFHINGGSYMI
jgi:3-oxoacyl-[acyl-carrier protein] reductase